MRHLFLVFSFVLFSFAARAEDVIGTLIEIEGTVTVNSKAAEVNHPISLDDTVTTGAESRAMIVFIDDTELTLSDNSELKIDAYVFDPDDTADNKAEYSILEGAFLYTSGLIGKKENPDITVNTPVGSMGIRGTEFWGGDLDGEYNVLVNDGRVNVKTDAGEELIEKGQGTSVKGRKFRPTAPAPIAIERLERAGKTVFLKRREIVRQRITENRARHVELRKKHQEKIKARFHEKKEQRKQNIDQKREQIKGEMQRKIENRKDIRPDHRPDQRLEKQIQNRMDRRPPQYQDRIEPKRPTPRAENR